ncbi:MAG TPA: alanine racemase [Acidimicrobiales bacterium]|jgi:D-serine deaminase-like pyridoxal phosphate-dependent protein
MRVADLRTPALVLDSSVLEHNLTAMARVRPGPALRPHVKATKTTSLARRQHQLGHTGFTCATVAEMEGLAAAGLSDDLLLANEVLDPERLSAAAGLDARVTVAVDSDATVDAAVAAGISEVLIDVNVGLPRCGCPPDDAGRLAERARAAGLRVRGVMGYEGLATIAPHRADRAPIVESAMADLKAAHADVGGDIVSAGSTVTYEMNTTATEIQAGSYAFMDTAFAEFEDLPFRIAMSLWSTVISTNADGYGVCDSGLKSLGMDHGNPVLDPSGVAVDVPTATGHDVLVVSDEHITFAHPSGSPLDVGDRVRVLPAHVDPTVAYHRRLWLADGAGPDANVIDDWAIDLLGW